MAYQYEKLDHKKLFHDTYNPRLPTSLHDSSQEMVYKYMLLEADVLSLIEAIGKNGFFPGEPIIVVQEGDQFKVVEGNRRLSAVKLIDNPILAPVLIDRVKEAVKSISDEIKNSLSEIPCLIADSSDDIEKVDKFLGFRHITGTKNWKSLERARYLNKMYDRVKSENLDHTDIELHKEVAKLIGSKSDYVKRILVGFEIYKKIEDKKFFKINNGDLNDQNFHFVNLADSLNRKNIFEYLGVDFKKENPIEELNLENLELWTRWIFEKTSGTNTRIKGSSSDLGKLDKVLACQSSKDEFILREKTLDEALIFAQDNDILFDSLIKKAISSLENAEKPLHSIKEFNFELENNLSTILSICKNLNRINNSKKQEEDDEFKLS